MTAEDRELILLLREDALERPLAESAGTALEHALIEAALDGRETLYEVYERLAEGDFGAQGKPAYADWSAALRSGAGAVYAVPRGDMAYYPWIAVDLFRGEDADRATLLEGLRATFGRRRGLLVAARDPGEVPGHVDVVTPETEPGLSVSAPSAIWQYCRAMLRSQPSCRVLACDLADATLLADALDGHAVAIAVHGEVPPRAPGTRGKSERRNRRELFATLRWLAACAGTADDDSPFEELEHAGAVAWQRLAAASAVMLADRQEDVRKELLEVDVEAVFLPWSDAAIASHLTPGENQVETRTGEEAEQREITVREVDLTARAPDAGGRRVVVACVHLLGDALAATALLRTWRQRNSEDHVTFLVPDKPYARIFELSPDVDRIAFVSVPDPKQLIHLPSRAFVEGLSYWKQPFDERVVLDIQEVVASGGTSGLGLHMSEGYAHTLGAELESRLPSLDRTAALHHLPRRAPDAPYVVLARHTVSGSTVPPWHELTKRWDEEKWRRLAGRIRRELGLAVASIGTPIERRLETNGVRDLHDLSILEVAGLLAGAAALVTVDNGIFHLALGLGTPLVHLQPDWLGESWTASPEEAPHRDVLASLPKLSVTRVYRELRELLEQG